MQMHANLHLVVFKLPKAVTKVVQIVSYADI